jgi:hypothetical protein
MRANLAARNRPHGPHYSQHEGPVFALAFDRRRGPLFGGKEGIVRELDSDSDADAPSGMPTVIGFTRWRSSKWEDPASGIGPETVRLWICRFLCYGDR